MRIMCISFRYGRELIGGAEALFMKLMETLAAAGHEVDVYTTMSYDAAPSRDGYLVWDNQLFRPLPEATGGVTVRRFRVRNPRPSQGRRAAAVLARSLDEERAHPDFAARLAGCLSKPGGYLVAGWHGLEDWGPDQGIARWAGARATLAFRGDGVIGVRLALYASSPTSGRLTCGGDRVAFELTAGVDKSIEIPLHGRDAGYCLVEMDRTLKTPLDHRNLAVAVKSVSVLDREGEHSIPLESDFDAFLREAEESDLAAFLWDNALRRPRKLERLQELIIGPRSHGLERAVAAAIGGYDLVIANMIPMATFTLAAAAAERAGKPLVLVPLFHTRDLNHYWSHFHRAMAGADLVDGTSEADADLLSDQGFRTDFISPGFDVAEFENPDVDGARFREKHGLRADKVLLFVARKALTKRYDLAAEAVAELRRRGWSAWLVMIGPDEDRRPLIGEHVLYLGKQERSELLDAYDACDVFILPSEAESFGMVFCEAWLRRKPVLGNAKCAAIATLIEHGVDGFLATRAEEFADYAEELLRNPELARRMGENGYRKVAENFTWERVGYKAEALLQGVVGSRRERGAPSSSQGDTP